jgi:hypothetical protein
MTMIDVDWKPSDRILRQFGFVSLLFFGLLGGYVFWRGSLFGFDLGSAAQTVAVVLWAVAGMAALLSLCCPRANRPLYVALVALTFPIGLVVSFGIMTVLFYLVITPLGLVMRLLGKRPIHVKWKTDGSTYWTHRPPESRGPERYFSQF